MTSTKPNPRTVIEKIVARHTVNWNGLEPPRAGDFVTIRPRHVMTHDNSSAVIDKFWAIVGQDAGPFDPLQPVFVMDHDIQNHSSENIAKYAKIRTFAERHGIYYKPPGRGIAHQVMIEDGFVTPGSLVVGSDSHSNMYGALAALGTPVVRTDAAAIWATGISWWVIPQQTSVVLHGQLASGVTGKDVILALCAHFPHGEILNTTIEFSGDGIKSLSIDDRLTIANMTTEWGALAAYFPYDDVLDSYLELLGIKVVDDLPTTDDGAVFLRVLELDLSSVSPHVTGPNSVIMARTAKEVERDNIAIDKAFLMSCVNGRLTDFESAAACFVDGRTVASHVNFYIAAASDKVESAARESGAWQILLNAGAIPLPPGCGACIGLGTGTLKAGEVGISATNRNFEGRMGSRDSDCYLASPAVVAESAIRGYIASPVPHENRLIGNVKQLNQHQPVFRSQFILDGFPELISGRSLLLTSNDINTDGIYGKDVTYQDHISVIEQGRHAMLNYDPCFQQLAMRGDIIVAGERFGAGSSREQAATSLCSRGISLVIAASVSQTFVRNAFNNGLIVLECSELSETLLAPYHSSINPPRTAVGSPLTVNFKCASISVNGQDFHFQPLNEIAQRLIIAGGLEASVRSTLRRMPVQEEGLSC